MPAPNLTPFQTAEGTSAEAEALLSAALVRARTRRPGATYRVQLHAKFGFRDALAIVPYLDALGVTDLYLSPFLRAQAGSQHGYDVVDHGQLNPEIGTEEDLIALSDALTARKMGLLVDVVPNHVGIGSKNARWLDVLENGPSSIHARFFDIDWAPLKPELAGKILLPILGDHYGAVLERGELQLSFENGAFWLKYFDERLPIAPRSKRHILRHGLAELEATSPPEDVHVLELLSVITALENLPPIGVTTPAKVIERHREKEVVKRRLSALVEQSDAIRAHIDRAVATLNGNKDDPSSFDLLDALLDEQAYRLAYWRVAGEEINYRRFFDINGLAAIRQEDPIVFEETHRVILRLLREGRIDGMRIDHPDGLYDPAEYLRMLQEEVVVCAARDLLVERAGSKELGEAQCKLLESSLRRAFAEAFRKDPRDLRYRPLYVVVEKILSRKERIPEDWAIDGTTGYEFLNLLNGIFVARENERRLDDTYLGAVGRVELAELVRRNKKMIMKTSMVSELNVLAHRLSSLSERSRHTRDFTLNSLRHALIEMVACFPIYRTYIHDWSVDDRDRAFIEQAYAEARKRTDEIDVATLDFLRDILLMKPILGPGESAKQQHLAFVMKLQQVTGPVMAKGLEDTTFYVYNRLVSLNEVGGEPERFGISVEAFHRANDARRRRWPASLLATSTHDTKRSEDVRARIDVLSELPDAWHRFVAIAREANEKRKVRVGERLVPDAAEELLFYQTLLGAAPSWPVAADEKEGLRTRIEDYMLKAVKEAKVNNSWTNHDPAYDEGIRGFIRHVFDVEADDPFGEALRALHKRCTRAGRINSIAAEMLKACAPGVPDVYQGTELFDLSLVDPDNRRPVDYERRAKLLGELDARTDRLALARELMQRPDDRLKLFVTATTLRTRRALLPLFLEGSYVPLETVGPRGQHLCAFARVHQRSIAIVVAPRLVSSLVGDRNAWSDTFIVVHDEIAEQIEEGEATLVDAFTGEARRLTRREGAHVLPAAEILRDFPLALLSMSA